MFCVTTVHCVELAAGLTLLQFSGDLCKYEIRKHSDKNVLSSNPKYEKKYIYIISVLINLSCELWQIMTR